MLPAGCAHHTEGIRPTDPVDLGSVYFYGRFFIRSDMDAQTVGLFMSCSDGAEYRLWLSTDRMVQVIRAKPAICALTEVVYTNADGDIVSHLKPPAAWVHPSIFDAGHAYYLGDFVGATAFKVSNHILFNEYRVGWTMDAVDENFGLTTREMKRSFPNLATLPVADLRFAPRRRPPQRTGGLLADELLSPARVARIAPFLNSQYATLAECASACGKGQCLPFRADTGPAIECIHRCKADADCPPHLACNCSLSKRTDCLAIAELPDDAVNGICMPAAAPPAAHRPPLSVPGD
jgi:hypothetical protein